jgi:hypothetical protein
VLFPLPLAAELASAPTPLPAGEDGSGEDELPVEPIGAPDDDLSRTDLDGGVGVDEVDEAPD